MRVSTTFLRSAPGQLTLLAILYGGAVLLAVAALCLRSVAFEPFIRERVPPLPERLAELARTVAEAPGGKELPPLSGEDVDLLVGAWIDEPDLDPQGHLAEDLLARRGAAVLEHVRRTLVVGDPPQRARAVALLGRVTTEELKPQALALCRYARRRAEARGDSDLAAQASATLARLAPPS
jgi:hypothetical protein